MSNTLCAEQLQRFHSSQQKSHHLHNIDVPPRKLLSRRGSARTTSFNSDSAMSPQSRSCRGGSVSEILTV
ncbi:unnamed protein product [Rhodiola kirilowii]